MEKRESNKFIGGLLVGGVVVFILAAVNIMFEIKIGPSERLLKSLGQSKTNSPSVPVAPTPAISADEAAKITEAVIPAKGYTVNLKWGDIGKKLITSGAIDLNKFQQRYSQEGLTDLVDYLNNDKEGGITITQRNAPFWVNTLWALGLTQRSDVLLKGIMMTKYKKDLGNFASTGGWNLGKKDALKLYASTDIVKLTAEQQTKVAEIAANVYRPCCGNSTAFPDCNHGMAILGLIEIMVSQNFSEADIYKASLAFNSFFFPDTYLDLANYFKTKQNLDWNKVEPKMVLGQQYSSAQGYQNIKRQIVPQSGQGGGGSCGS